MQCWAYVRLTVTIDDDRSEAYVRIRTYEWLTAIMVVFGLTPVSGLPLAGFSAGAGGGGVTSMTYVSVPARVDAPAPVGTAARVGAVAWIVGAAQFLVANGVAQAAWTTPYSLAHNNISDLGAVSCGMFDEEFPRYICSPLHALFNASMIVQGVLLATGVLLTARLWGKGFLARTAQTLLVLAATGYLLAGLWPGDVNLDRHVLGAFLIMIVGNIGLVLAGFVPRDSLVGRLRWFTVTLGLVALAGVWMHFQRQFGALGLGGSERIAVFPLQLWTLVMGGLVLASARKNRPRAQVVRV
jgi:Predicted membrane protein